MAMVSLVDDGELSVTVQGIRDPEARRLRFTFSRFPAYRNIMEEYRLELWERLSGTQDQLGRTLIVADSPWVAALREKEPLLGVHRPTLVHYVICTEDDVVEVLAPDPPEMTWVEPGAPSESVGKSLILRHPDDRPQIEEAIKSVKRRSGGRR
ncbi:MAG: hypothetical protein WEE64_16570 [Dehalococcoidia bacterium]